MSLYPSARGHVLSQIINATFTLDEHCLVRLKDFSNRSLNAVSEIGEIGETNGGKNEGIISDGSAENAAK